MTTNIVWPRYGGWVDKKNPAQYPALLHATNRAHRTGEPMFVYVKDAEPHNIWFVRSKSEGVPAGAELFREIAPGALDTSGF